MQVAKSRPPAGEERSAKITTVLLDRQIAYLDRVAIDMRLRHHHAVSRAELIRALVEAASRSGVDLSEASSTDGIAELFASSMRRRRR